MAEFVQKRLEELLPELEQLERVQLFTKPEVRAVIEALDAGGSVFFLADAQRVARAVLNLCSAAQM